MFCSLLTYSFLFRPEALPIKLGLEIRSDQSFGGLLWFFLSNSNINWCRRIWRPLFWAHYSYLKSQSQKAQSSYADLLGRKRNPNANQFELGVSTIPKFEGYGRRTFGLTASYSVRFFTMPIVPEIH